jgi:AGCS family alanine or glycine:cation symporter
MIEQVKQLLTLGLIFPVVLLVGGYFSYQLKLLQITKLFKAISLVTTKQRKGGMSSFGAMAAILGGNLGTGNISGVAVAIMTGGPGSLFWMWVMAILASITKYVGCFLGVHFQIKNKKGEWEGGPMFYLRDGLVAPIIAKIFCLLTIFAALTVGNLVQVHALSLPIYDMSINPLFFGLMMALLVGGVILGGLRRFSLVVQVLVPPMAILYVGTCLVLLFLNRQNILPSLNLIFTEAFSLKPLAGGALGFGILQAIRAGFDRGLFATDSGLGLAPILHGAVYDPNPHIDNRHVQGLISILSPMIVMVVCTVTGLVLISTQAYTLDLPSTTMCMEAFKIGLFLPWAGHIVSVTLFFFAFTTMLTWCFCAQRASEFLWGLRAVKPFQWLFIILVPAGVYIEENLVWTIADISTNFMFLTNMVGVAGLSALVINTYKSKNR